MSIGSMGSINKQISRYEFTPVYTHPEAKADIILIHGLNGDPERTWTAKNGVFWPADLMPSSLRGNLANILVYGYNADVFSARHGKSASSNFIQQHAQTLVTLLTLYRKSEYATRKPIIWVAHSLGGILLKRALLYSNDLQANHSDDFRSIFVSTYGVVFLGTPHTGTEIASWGHMLQSMVDVVVPRKFFESEPVLLKTLKKDNEVLQTINTHFLDIYQRFRIHMAHENHKTNVKGTKMLVVDAASASPQLPGVTYYGIEATHQEMCRFHSASAPGYRTVSTALREWVGESPAVIQVRWEVEDDDRRLRANLEHFERLRPYNTRQAPHEATHQNPSHVAASSSTQDLGTLEVEEVDDSSDQDSRSREWQAAPGAQMVALRPPVHSLPDSVRTEPSTISRSELKEEPLFIHPESFRPNSFFIGRDEEMETLHLMLTDRRRRAQGTSAVLIQSLPGGGKTHLARQYVFEHRDDYSGGVYWVRAKSLHELEYWFWRIAKNEALRGLVQQEDVEELRNPKKIVDVVRKWLNSQENWLMVLDGVQFDMPGLRDFIPDARNTSLIYTSTERAVTGDPAFDNPQVIELGLMTAKQAQEFLLSAMAKKQPWNQDDLSRALELVQLMGRLPVMIHVAAQHLKATREPLSKYLRSYKKRPKVGELEAYKIVRDQLQHRGANAALNLISILAFFDQHVPVEMVIFGLPVLDKVTPVKTSDASHNKLTLDNTLRVLIAFALVERTESDDISPKGSQSSNFSFDKNFDYIDLLRLHSVVQAFFIETLNEERQVQFWLQRAVAVWCRSYDEADRRISEDDKIGLPDDYRRFHIHGKKLLTHLDRFERRHANLAEARAAINVRIAEMEAKITQRSETLQAHIVSGSGELPPTSVFERANGSSQSDSASASMPPSHSSSMSNWSTSVENVSADGSAFGDEKDLDDYGFSKGDADEVYPSPYLDTLDSPNPYHWHMPYPLTPIMPPTPKRDFGREDKAEEDGKRTPVPSQDLIPFFEIDNKAVQQGILSPLRSSAFAGGRRAADRPYSLVEGTGIADSPRAGRQSERPGVWTDGYFGNARVSVSRELARGAITTIGSQILASPVTDMPRESVAQRQLASIKGVLTTKENKAVDSVTPLNLTPGRPGRAPNSLDRHVYGNIRPDGKARHRYNVSSVSSPGDNESVASQRTATPATRTSGSFQARKGAPASRAIPMPVITQNGKTVAYSPVALFPAPHSTSSSPGPLFSPFVSGTPIPHQSLPSTLRPWDTQTQAPPRLTRVDSSSLGAENDTSQFPPAIPIASHTSHHSSLAFQPSRVEEGISPTDWAFSYASYSTMSDTRDSSRRLPSSWQMTSGDKPIAAQEVVPIRPAYLSRRTPLRPAPAEMAQCSYVSSPLAGLHERPHLETLDAPRPDASVAHPGGVRNDGRNEYTVSTESGSRRNLFSDSRDVESSRRPPLRPSLASAFPSAQAKSSRSSTSSTLRTRWRMSRDKRKSSGSVGATSDGSIGSRPGSSSHYGAASESPVLSALPPNASHSRFSFRRSSGRTKERMDHQLSDGAASRVALSSSEPQPTVRAEASQSPGIRLSDVHVVEFRHQPWGLPPQPSKAHAPLDEEEGRSKLKR